ncbi:class I SAM-dependent methyltransferase [Aestuariivirga sp.]|uniref:class I SAM-dependent methyltransferase n=1 Tax=Aestuariivirga sp. TaxID=2650926 RepID=UPI003BACC272
MPHRHCNADRFDISAMSYPDFVGMTGYPNQPPGGDCTINLIVRLSGITDKSYLLDLACSSGFSSIQLYSKVRCSFAGVDISEIAIRQARQKCFKRNRISGSYIVCDACALPFPDSVFSHAVCGASFGFIRNREAALREVTRVLAAEGMLLPTILYYNTRPPKTLINELATYIGYSPNISHDLQYWKDLFLKQYHIEGEVEIVSDPPEREQIQTFIDDFIEKELPDRVKLSCSVPDIRRRLLSTRLLLAEHCRYQSSRLLVLRKIER